MERYSASDIKKLGWKAVSTRVHEYGPVLITNHNRPDAVVMDSDHYQALVASAERNDPLQKLRAQFARRLEQLESTRAANDFRRAISASPEELAHAANRAKED
ncbi:MAG: type II toxin-antitoxin system prevent-host-death family antitoxin [Wenzhouxiangella sp.]